MGVNVGYEQDGTGTEHGRPVVVLRGFSRQVCLVVPLSRSQKDNKYYVNAGTVDGKAASAIISQIRLVDTKRFVNRIGIMDIERFDAIRKAVRGLL